MENENINNLLLNAISSVQEKNNKNKEKIEVLSKTAKVINYDETNYTATVYMIDDQEQNEYILYNKSGEILSENDSVRVFYTTSVSKGWIGMRLGEPVVKDGGGNTYIIQAYTVAIHFTNTGFDLTFSYNDELFENKFIITENASGDITKILNETTGRIIDVTYD